MRGWDTRRSVGTTGLTTPANHVYEYKYVEINLVQSCNIFSMTTQITDNQGSIPGGHPFFFSLFLSHGYCGMFPRTQSPPRRRMHGPLPPLIHTSLWRGAWSKGTSPAAPAGQQSAGTSGKQSMGNNAFPCANNNNNAFFLFPPSKKSWSKAYTKEKT